ncbi:LacI family DNA-binding transcriptional regulator [Halothermothrix orenii]|uniref:Transcriptional regulator, LacI family n=1 Tax=Halothermothrix orenii (strain H 168 / OCM 544 / DSM 9562) TaxID=373903 RepID=B8CZU6_HALOH|nr:LacI family DNA-binding transcriptional regulator [Halothermothrix orenii]ACL70798.1 transcriptional regulator, LacI family [Halothermothrix orenii H 168]
MAVTLKDVAKKAGVSLATTSLALNESDKVKEETYLKVHRVARELNYIPNARARALVKRKTRAVGLVIPEVENPFFAELSQAIKDTLHKKKYNVILCSTDYKTEEEIRYINLFKSGMVDGAIFACLGEMMKGNNELILDLARNHVPVVYIDRESSDNELIPVIKSDLKEGSYKLTKYLIELGHEDIGFVGQSLERMEGYKKAMAEYNLPVKDKFLFYNYLTIEGGIEVGTKLLNYDRLPTALVCLNDEMAIGVLQALTREGIRVPEDISICGIDNIKISNFYNPPLTTVNVPKKEMGKKAAELLLKLIFEEHVDKNEQFIIYNTDLIIRRSATSPRKTNILL